MKLYENMVQGILDHVYDSCVELQGKIKWDYVLKQSDRIEMPVALIATDDNFCVMPVGANTSNFGYMGSMREICEGATILGFKHENEDEMIGSELFGLAMIEQNDEDTEHSQVAECLLNSVWALFNKMFDTNFYTAEMQFELTEKRKG